MRNIEIIEVFKRYMNTSGLSDKHRNLFEDTQSMFAWLNKVYSETDDELTKRLVTDLSLDCMWRTFKTARYRKVNYLRCCDGKWDSRMLKDAERVIDQLKVTEKVGDTDTANNLWLGVFNRFIIPCLKKENMPELGMYIYELLTNRTEYGKDINHSTSERASLYLSCNDEDTLDQQLNKLFRPKRNESTKCNMETEPEIFSALRKKAHDAKENGDVATLHECIEETTKLYMQGYFYRPAFGEDDEIGTYQSMLRVINNNINSIGSDEEPSNYNPLDLIKIAVESSKETDEEP